MRGLGRAMKHCGHESLRRLPRHLVHSADPGRGRGAVCLDRRRRVRLRHRRIDAIGAGAAGGRRTGRADHRDFGPVHQFQPRLCISEICRLAAHGDCVGGRRADLRARCLGLHKAFERGRRTRDRQHADPERAAAPAVEISRRQGPRRRIGARFVRLWRRGRRHGGFGRDFVVAADGGRCRRRRRHCHRCRHLDCHRDREDLRVRDWPA